MLKTTKNGSVYAYPSDMWEWDSADPRWILGTTWLATKIHSD